MPTKSRFPSAKALVHRQSVGGVLAVSGQNPMVDRLALRQKEVVPHPIKIGLCKIILAAWGVPLRVPESPRESGPPV